ncbi:MAG: hypothetical protein RMI34_10730 [Chloroherpetonaceae bacterium]|nr:hypothetical protein [Chloroherpetonaceae bacterium]MCS7210548.1 hypothetical protein [Chloroherpetonaceae bacterium]MDW8020537.1 hypothetical protein [Chloroherpetonaceae bacterium]MDW8467194.1 hypothetical protein [Chloroherpetonaceae bacterium]
MHQHAVCLFETEHGAIFFCKDCGTIHLEFGNVILEFTMQGFETFCDSLNTVDFAKCEQMNHSYLYRRKLILSFERASIKAAFYLHEIHQLQELARGAAFMLAQRQLCEAAQARLN